ncbi:hypothetical protein GS436_21030, partial [Rhodococcus hoagii]|nr:hypothetical protein [Prescottella equi]
EPTQELFDYGHAAEVAAAEFWKHPEPGWRLSTARCSTGVTTSGSPRLRRSTAVVRGARARRVVEVKTAESLRSGATTAPRVPADYASIAGDLAEHVTGWHRPADLVLCAHLGPPRIYTVEYRRALAPT